MSATATIPFASSQPATRPWTPTSRDRLIFQWVKFDGHQQSWVAAQLGINQSTVSRIVERYERWIARGGPSQQGAPNHEERLRAQRWLAYERNEWIIASALRLAGEMERTLDTTQSTVLHPRHDPSQQSKVRTEYKVIDRSGIAARFLRLAYRINMDQLKLAGLEPLPALEPLTTGDLTDDLPLPPGGGWGEGLATDSSDTFAATPDDACSPGHPLSGSAPRADNCLLYPNPLQPEEQPTDEPPSPAISPLPPDSRAVLPDFGEPAESTAPSPICQLKTENRKLDPPAVSVIELSPNAPPVHKTHKLTRAKSIVNANRSTTSANSRRAKKSSATAYAVASSSPELATCQVTATPHHEPPA